MKITIITKDMLEKAYDEACKETTLESMVEIASILTNDGEHINIFMDKNDEQLICLCEDDECQFDEENVISFEDVYEYIRTHIRKLFQDEFPNLKDYNIFENNENAEDSLQEQVKKTNFSVFIGWGECGEEETGKCVGYLSKLSSKDKKEAYERRGDNYCSGKGGMTFDCYTTVDEAIQLADYNPLALEYFGDFSDEDINQIFSTVKQMFKENKLAQYRVEKKDVEKFISDFKSNLKNKS